MSERASQPTKVFNGARSVTADVDWGIRKDVSGFSTGDEGLKRMKKLGLSGRSKAVIND